MDRRQFKIPQLRKARRRNRGDDATPPGQTARATRDALEAEREPDSSIGQPDRLHGMPPRGPKQGLSANDERYQCRAVLYDAEGSELAEIPCEEAAGITILGRGANATVRLKDPYTHRVHSHLRWDESERAHFIAHGGGENATYVNKRKIRTPQRLHDGVRIRVGRTEIIYRIEDLMAAGP